MSNLPLALTFIFKPPSLSLSPVVLSSHTGQPARRVQGFCGQL